MGILCDEVAPDNDTPKNGAFGVKRWSDSDVAISHSCPAGLVLIMLMINNTKVF